MEVALAPVMEADADLEDAVIEAAVGSTGGAPEELEGLVLLEELAGVELIDPVTQLGRRRLVAASADGLVDRTAGNALRSPGRFAVPTTCWRARAR